MDAEVSGAGVRQLASFIRCLNSVGSQILFEAVDDRVVLRALNDSSSAFVACHLTPGFFDSMVLEDGQPKRCQFLSKHALNALKSTKGVERVRICFTESDGTQYIVFQLTCEGNRIKTHALFYEDTDIMQAVFDRDSAPHCMTTKPRTLIKLAEHMQGCSNVQLVAKADGIELKSHHAGQDPLSTAAASAGATARHLTTQLSVGTEEFLTFVFSAEQALQDRAGSQAGDAAASADDVHVAMAFSLKEFKSVLLLAEAVRVPSLALFYYSGGGPLLLTSQQELAATFSIDLIMATTDPQQQEAAES